MKKELKMLFNYGSFKLHSGKQSLFKIDCDKLSDVEIEALAMLALSILPKFGYVEGVPQGGLRLAEALSKWVDLSNTKLLIVDDVLTTGNSMESQRAGREAVGLVIFNRTIVNKPELSWIKSLFHVNCDLAAL